MNWAPRANRLLDSTWKVPFRLCTRSHYSVAQAFAGHLEVLHWKLKTHSVHKPSRTRGLWMDESCKYEGPAHQLGSGESRKLLIWGNHRLWLQMRGCNIITAGSITWLSTLLGCLAWARLSSPVVSGHRNQQIQTTVPLSRLEWPGCLQPTEKHRGTAINL